MHPGPSNPFPSAGLLFGVAYYAEYHQSDRLAEDLDLMAAADITVIRVGESVWSTWEPEDGRFELEWLARVLDGALTRGIQVIIGTPTYAVPPWMSARYPDIAAESATGTRVPWGSRQEVDYTHPVFRQRAERVIRAIVARYAPHPAVIGLQVDNEPGLRLFHNDQVFAGFKTWLQDRYGDTESLNHAWGLTYWSHRLTDWDELWRPDGNSSPQYDLDWRRYQAQLTTDFIGWQTAIVREYARADQFVTTCLQYPRPGLDDRSVAEALDVIAGNPYYGMQDRLAAGRHLSAQDDWITSGVAGLLRQADRLYSTKQARYLVTETNAQAIGPAHANFPPYPGQLRQSAFALLSRGAAMIEYWHWHTLPFGAETYWGGVLPHSLRPGRVYAEVAEIGAQLRQLGSLLDGYTPDADIAMIWSTPSRFAFQYMPPFAVDGRADPESYEHVFDAFHRGVIDAGLQARILHMEQARQRGPQDMARTFPVLMVVGCYITTDEDLEFLRDYAAAGGHLVLGVRTGYADEQARVRVAVAPATLAGAAGVWFEEFSNLEVPIAITSAVADFPLPDSAEACNWVDGLVVDDARILARYRHPRFGDFPVVTTRAHEGGRITVVGTVPSPPFAQAIAAWAVPRGTNTVVVAPECVSVSSGMAPDGRRVLFVFNWGWDDRSVTVLQPVVDPITGSTMAANERLSLPGWGAQILVTFPGSKG